MYKNIICFFSFPFITQNIRMIGPNKRVSKTAELHTHRGRVTNLQWTIFLFWSLDRNFPSYMIFQTPTQILAVLKSAAHATHMITLFSSIPPTQFTWHFRQGHLRSVYFRHLVHFLLFMFPVSDFHSCIDMSKGSSSQYPTHTAR